MKQIIRIILANMKNQYHVPKDLYGINQNHLRERYCMRYDIKVKKSNTKIAEKLVSDMHSLEIIIFSELQSDESERLKGFFENRGYLYIQPLHKLKGRQLVTAMAINKNLANQLKLPNRATSTLLTETPLQYRNCTIESDLVSFTALYLPPRTDDIKRNNITNNGVIALSKYMVDKFTKHSDKIYLVGGDLNIDFEKIRGLDIVKNNINKIPISYNAWNHLNSSSLSYSNKKDKTKIDHLFTNVKIIDFDNKARDFDTDHTFPIITLELDL